MDTYGCLKYECASHRCVTFLGCLDFVSVQGFAYVEFETSQGLQRAVDMTGIEFHGENLNIKINNAPIGGGGGRAPSRGGRGPGRGNAS